MDASRMTRHKSSRSLGNNEECVEVSAIWRRSSKSSGGGQACVEVAGTPRSYWSATARTRPAPGT
ncbi:DUF397 domain-containing protein [Actinomadura sp. NAK00032]|uniref:DUF397 domain-containing protein n=1 Tax=Actinomadura sp. NAK00032 TaxID=2742128 RepID=UPI0034A5A158